MRAETEENRRALHKHRVACTLASLRETFSGEAEKPSGGSATGRTPGPASPRESVADTPTPARPMCRELLGEVLQIPVQELERATLRVGEEGGGGGVFENVTAIK